MKLKNLSGQKFGRLTAIRYKGKNKYNRSLWLCQCECGNFKIISSNSLQQGNTKSCGCLNKEKHISNPNRITHGYSDDLTIDRIEPTGNYKPSNCRWVTPAVQATNKRKGGVSH